jgi:hypothetical protein
MSLSSLWKSQGGELGAKHIQAMVGLADDGKLRDGNKASKEFCEFLTNVPSSMLARYANECLGDEKFAEASSALQDVINEVGRRLGFMVQNGLYRGKANEIGNDGLWHSDDGSAIILEVKTTATYTIDLDTLANYRKKLAAENKIELEKSSILIVIGRNEKTDSLEAQVRGSRHAWDIRLISVDMLMRLVAVKEDLETPQAVQKIRQILRPKEYTKVDEIIDLVFSAAKEVKEEEKLQLESEPAEEGEKKFTPVNFREACITKIQAKLKTVLIKRTAALFSSSDEKVGIICLNSRRHEQGKQSKYWFAFHPHQKEAIAKYPQGYVAFGCGSAEMIVFIPAKEFVPWLERFWTTELEDRSYWHVRIVGNNAKLTMDTKAEFKPIDVTQYLFK